MIKHYYLKKSNVSVFQQPKHGMNCCGDSFFIKETDDFFICGIADGLGSGSFAKEASKAAIDVLTESINEPLRSIMGKINESQQNLRGVVMSLFKIDLKNRQGYFCGIGNIGMIINNGETLHEQPLPKRGYLSGKPIDIKVYQFEFPKDGWFALFSDGIRVQSKQLPRLYRLLGSPDEKDAIGYVDTYAVRNLNDDATLVIGRFV